MTDAAALERLDACPLCGGREADPWRRARDRSPGAGEQVYAFAKCRACGVIYLSVRPPVSEIAGHYPADYAPHHRRDAGPKRASPVRLPRAVKALFADPFGKKHRAFYTPPRAGATLLDFGCGAGEFLDEARERGWHTVGTDLSQACVALARERGHEAHLYAEGFWSSVADASLDAVRMNHVLEHLFDPLEVLARLRKKMKPGARIDVGLPHPGSAASRFFAGRWFGLECPRHIMLFDPTVAERLLRQAGFASTETHFRSDPATLFKSILYLLEDLGVESEGVSRALRPGGRLAAVFTLPMRPLAAVGLSDKFHVFARSAA